MEGTGTKLAESKYHYSRNLYLPKPVADMLNLKLGETIEYHTDGENVILRKSEVNKT